MSQEMVTVYFINNEEGGFAGNIQVPQGTTAAQLFESKLPGKNPGDYYIRLNLSEATADQVLCNDDRFAITPQKIDGAK